MMWNKKTFNENIRQIIKSHGSVKAVGEKWGISTNILYKLTSKKAEYDPKLSDAVKIAENTGCDLVALGKRREQYYIE